MSLVIQQQQRQPKMFIDPEQPLGTPSTLRTNNVYEDETEQGNGHTVADLLAPFGETTLNMPSTQDGEEVPPPHYVGAAGGGPVGNNYKEEPLGLPTLNFTEREQLGGRGRNAGSEASGAAETPMGITPSTA